MLKLETRADLQSLVDDGVEESLTLDYKASLALVRSNDAINELCKDVSALANSTGGQIVYGIEENKVIITHKPERVDDGISDPKITREWIVQILPHREVVWVIFGQISSGCLLLLLPLWACGQRTCVVHHVHSDVGRAAYSIRGSVTSPCPALGPTGASRTRMQRPRTATRPEACR
jgi:Putative DNA-binding domain